MSLLMTMKKTKKMSRLISMMKHKEGSRKKTSSLTLTRKKMRRPVASPRSCRTWTVSVRLLNSRSLKPISRAMRRKWPWWKTVAAMRRPVT